MPPLPPPPSAGLAPEALDGYLTTLQSVRAPNDSNTFVRLMDYPNVDPRRTGFPAHYDLSIITFIFARTPGMQVRRGSVPRLHY